MMQKEGLLIVFSGPSGVGKGTVLREYLQEHPNVKVSVSATTRSPRPGEVDGVHYHFLSREQFQEMIQQDGLLEYACYSGNYYGTPKAAVQEQLNMGNHVVLEIEVQGALQILKKYPQALLIFVMPPSYQELERRLRERNTESEEEIQRRLQTAIQEMAQADQYDFILLNDQVPLAEERLDAIVQAAPYLKRQMKSMIDEVLHDAQTIPQ